MKKLNLHFSSIVQGEFRLQKLNFLFVFQVNCPGCFLYGIPFVNELYKEFSQNISFLGLSTAFEDFEYNNELNTKQLIKTGQVVGETKKTLEQQGFDSYPNPIEFPIAIDEIADDSFDFTLAAEKICRINPNYNIWPKFEQDIFLKRVITYLKSQEEIALTFTLNQLRGTPTMIVFNDTYEVLFEQFGHVQYETIKTKLKSLIDTFGKDY
ncbi:hypothetical protein [Aquimarina sp. 2201CG5-10]|uniref:hypothetical protein n=1 Tax=Aquimarina callyspongiae TaxID=3098150 RepID=UPI002AB596EB|nr:hypothetical protein [Aquimarina sp. 2201CG5-10]MDY8134653.1 hypothetical protein [Aquimarina sp. 2201CG5-10]